MSTDRESPDATRTATAWRVAARDRARTLIWVGLLVLAYTLINALVPPTAATFIIAGNVLLGIAFILVGLQLSRRAAGPSGTEWVFAWSMTALVLWLLFVYWLDPVTRTCCTSPSP